MRIHRLVLIGYFAALPAAALALDASEAAAPVDAFAQISQSKPAEKASELIMYALSLIGVNYKFGGTSPSTGLDCSGYVKHVFSQVEGMSLPHNALAISRLGKKVTPDELQPGDLVFYKTLRRTFSHVGIYLGDNRFVHAPSNGGGVEIVDMKESYWAKRFNGARRVLFSRTTPASSAE